MKLALQRRDSICISGIQEDVMKFYHGTTLRSAIKIAEMGFLPRKGAVWFTTSKQYAQGRAKQKARRTGSSPFVLACEIMVNNINK